MRSIATILVLLLAAPACLQAQPNAAQPDDPEEVIVTGNRDLLALRTRMLDAERQAYDVFNSLNDDRRFEISCTEQEATGSRFRNQLCQPAFVRNAAAEHGRAFWENLRAYHDPATQDKNPPPPAVPYEIAVQRHQRAYQDKMKQVAEKHPEFLEALVNFV